MNEIGGGVCAPVGFRASGVRAYIKNLKVSKKDCALIVSDHPASIAGCFTTNLMKAPPIAWTEGVCIRGAARAVFINSGNANACTGSQGLEDAQATAEQVAASLNVPITEVAVLSTGVIGVQLPMDRIRKGVAASAEALSPQGSADAAEAIMTTDTMPKEAAIELELNTGRVRLGAVAKGAGMIAPNMATMFCILTTDAKMGPELLRDLLRPAVAHSFNCICIDNDMSTSDAVVCMANGQAGLPELQRGSADANIFGQALRQMCTRMAQWLVRDGEGATKFVTLKVTGARDDAEARQAAKAVAQSQLCKTAFFGSDPNWGRIACALGYSGVKFDPTWLGIHLDSVELLHNGLPTFYSESEAAAVMRQKEFVVSIVLGDGPGRCTFWTSDLSHEYIRINADYRT